jgi:hypothetical protein
LISKLVAVVIRNYFFFIKLHINPFFEICTDVAP